MDFLDEVKESLRPDKSVIGKIDEFLDTVNKSLKQKKISAVCAAGGSVAKGTFLKDDFDVDIFVRFSLKHKHEDISGLLEKALVGLDFIRLHGSRDYFQLKDHGLNYELVPVLDIIDPKDAVNVTDMSPMHVAWVSKHLKKGQADEIRLAKKFCKSVGCYGAESYISGFSGHVIDILIVHYGSFLGLLKDAAKWKDRKIIDTEHHYKTGREILFELNQSKVSGPLIIVDPILKSRNASSAVSKEKFDLFTKKAKEFLKKPSIDYFEENAVTIDSLKKKYIKNLVIMVLSNPPGKKDILGSKILKAFKFLSDDILHLGFSIKESGWSWDKSQTSIFWFVFSSIKLPEKKIVVGPPIEMEEGCTDFKKKHPGASVRAGKLISTEVVIERSAEKNIRFLMKKKYYDGKVMLQRIIEC